MISTAYTDAILDEIVQNYQVTKDQRKIFHRDLIAAEWTWRKIENYPTRATPDKEIRRELETISDAADAFQTALSSLSLASWLIMERTSQGLADSKYSPIIDYADNPTGLPSITVFDDNEVFERPKRTSINMRGLEVVVSQIYEISDCSIEYAYLNKPGRKPDPALETWMLCMRSLWVRLGREFKRDVSETGQANSEAARFCVDAYNILSPDTPSTKVLNAMKKTISSHNR